MAPGVCAYTTFRNFNRNQRPTCCASIAKTMFPEFRRQFCDDQLLRKTLQELAGKFGTALLRLKQPAHRADIFRYVYHFQHGGLYLDIKCGFVVPWQRVLEHLAADWSTAHSSAAQRAGNNHPRLRQTTQHAFGRQVFAAKANLVGSAEERHGANPSGGVECQSHLWSDLPFSGAPRQEAHEDL